jgi:hypothetical protein
MYWEKIVKIEKGHSEGIDFVNRMVVKNNLSDTYFVEVECRIGLMVAHTKKLLIEWVIVAHRK